MKKLTVISVLVVLGLVMVPLAAWATGFSWTGISASRRFEWQTPKPQGNNITAVDFVTAATGWAVGANGTVIKTADGGYTWTQQGPIAPQGSEDVVHDMTDVCFVDASNGWATGGNMVWRTTNGGTTWTDITPEYYDPDSSQAIMWQSVSFADANNGWVVGRDRIYHTTNGGANWTPQASPEPGYLYRVVALSSTRALVSGSFAGVLSTDNSGASWTQRTLEGTAHEAAWADSFAAATYLRFYVAADGKLFKTVDGGSSWTTQTVGADIEEVCTVDGDLVGDTAWAYSSSGNNFKTVNGGTDWTPGSATPSYPSSPDAPTSTTIFLTTGQVYGATDGGTFYIRRYSETPLDAVESIDFIDASTGYAVGGQSYWWTTDGGATWDFGVADPIEFANDVFFLESTPTVGWIVGESSGGNAKVIKTENGGTTWTPLVDAQTAFREVHFTTESEGWGTNNAWGGFWHSDDGGAHWTKVLRDGFFWDVDFVDEDNGWIALDPNDGTNKVLHTGDGGSTWTTQTVPPSGGNVYQLDFVDANNGWCSDTFGHVYRTTNGGATWSELSSSPGATVDIEDIKFTSPTEGWIVGEQWTSSVLSSYRHDFAAYTKDGGVTWDYQANPTAADNGSMGSAVHVNAVDSIAGDTCWVGGGGGSILQGTAAPMPEPTTLSRTSSYATLSAYGKTYSFRGKLTAGGSGLGGKRVVLQSSSSPSGLFADTASSATTYSDGTFSITVVPRSKTYYRARFAGVAGSYEQSHSTVTWVRPRPLVGTPKAPKVMRKSKYYTVYGYMKPQHRAGSYPIRIYKWKKTASGKWKSYGYVKAKASDYYSFTKYKRKIRLSRGGRWRLRAYAPADSGHAAKWSSGYDYVTVK